MKAIINGKLVFPEEIREGILLIDGDRILASGDCLVPAGAEVIDAQGLFVGPGLSDEHCHGYMQNGVCYNINDGVRRVGMAHLKHGTTQFLPSPSYGRKKEIFLQIIEDANEVIAAGDTNLVGLHFEGPFTSPFHGARAENAWEYTDENARELFERAGKNVKHVTYAPELPCARALEALIREYGVISDIGHTHAGEADVNRAVENGVRIITHLFDAMSNDRFFDESDPRGMDRFQRNHPQASTADIVLGIPGLWYELICDSRFIHVSAPNIRMAYRCAGEDNIICISDATAHPDALKSSDYPPEDRRSAPDLNFNDRNQLSGSRLTAAMSVQNFMRATGCDVRVAFKVGSSNSMKALKLYDQYGSIHAGKYANLIFVDEKFGVKKVLFKGKEVEEVRG